ncbi:hypothetical protein [Sansalvadorimonas verongulae]|uniref:hypothetical protein n=1 Tax=Sansalvadorimonas verongulae TaxID=2172824 RepID=UPI0012BC9372|nr:hypothetical protein [Sansalvadorimonas verongulae]MTI12140.1 hypothetical protein [Sansalvadorimonas verongulae]
MQVTNHIELLGLKAEDSVTGFKGVITSVSFDLYGCVQAVITPPVNKDGEVQSGNWFDVSRIKINGKKPVMQRPDFIAGYIAEGKKGCADKPLP